MLSRWPCRFLCPKKDPQKHGTRRTNKRIAKYQTQPRTVLLYLTGLDAGESLKVIYHLRATMPAKVAAAGARVYQYYDPDQRGISPAMRLTVLPHE